MSTILGLHTQVHNPEDQLDPRSHTWITIEENGVTKDYAFYPSNQRRVIELNQQNGFDGKGSTVREGVDSSMWREPTYSIEWSLNDQQAAKIPDTLGELGQKEFRIGRENCTSFGANFVEQVTGDRFPYHHTHEKAGEIPSPAVLEKSMREFDHSRYSGMEKEATGGLEKSTPGTSELPTPPLLRSFSDIMSSPPPPETNKSHDRDR